MKIVESQHQLLLAEIEQLRQENITLRDQKQGLNCYGARPSDSDYDIIQLITANERKLKALEHIEKHGEVITNPNSKRVEIGSVCKLFLKYSQTECELIETTLIEAKITREPFQNYTTINSKLGQAIYHKKIGEGFRYKTLDGSTVCGKIIGLEFYRADIGKTYVKSPYKDK